jgi:hypothetical protein
MVVDLLQVGDGPMSQELQGVVERPQSVQDVLLASPYVTCDGNSVDCTKAGHHSHYRT